MQYAGTSYSRGEVTPGWENAEEPVASENPAQALWRAVVARMLEDAGLAPTNADNSRWRLEARRWFKSRDFRTVCDLADFSPSAVLARVPA